MSARYKNPWHKATVSHTGPAFFETNVAPTEYQGYLIYERISYNVWDVVKDDVCLDQRAGLNGAKAAIDQKIIEALVVAFIANNSADSRVEDIYAHVAPKVELHQIPGTDRKINHEIDMVLSNLCTSQKIRRTDFLDPDTRGTYRIKSAPSLA